VSLVLHRPTWSGEEKVKIDSRCLSTAADPRKYDVRRSGGGPATLPQCHKVCLPGTLLAKVVVRFVFFFSAVAGKKELGPLPRQDVCSCIAQGSLDHLLSHIAVLPLVTCSPDSRTQPCHSP
jgi:hypothetical protein